MVDKVIERPAYSLPVPGAEASFIAQLLQTTQQHGYAINQILRALQGGTAAQVLSKIDGVDLNTEWVTGGGSTSPKLIVPVHADGSANVTMTNQANAEQFLGNNNRNIIGVDLTDFTEYRLVARVVTASASVNSPRLYAQYHTSFTTTVATHSPLGASGDVNLSLAVTGLIKTAWTTIAAGALADIFLTVLQNGGDAAADPAVAHVQVQFR